MKISLHFSSAFTTLWEKWPRARGERKYISISNRSQLIYMANASFVVKSKMGHIHLHTHPPSPALLVPEAAPSPASTIYNMDLEIHCRKPIVWR